MANSLTNSTRIDAPVGEAFACVRGPSHFILGNSPADGGQPTSSQ